MLGERSSNLSKLVRNIRHSHNVFSPHAFVAWMANCAGYQASVNSTTWNSHPEAPYSHKNTMLFRMFHQFADMVTDEKTRYFFKMSSGSPVRILLWLTSVVDQATILLTSGVLDPMNITRVLKGQYSAIATTKYDKARTLIADTIDKLGKIVNGTDSAPSCLLVQNYENDQEKKKSTHAATKGGPKKLHHDSIPGESHANKKPRITRGPRDYFLYNKKR
jgi:hypothetical protein